MSLEEEKMLLEEKKWDQLISTAYKLINPGMDRYPDFAFGGYLYEYHKEDPELIKNKADKLSFNPPLNVRKALEELRQNGDEILQKMRSGDKEATKVFVTALCNPQLAARFRDPKTRANNYGKRTEAWAQAFNGYTIINPRRPFLDKIAKLAREMGYTGSTDYNCQSDIIEIGPVKINKSNLDKISKGMERGDILEADLKRCVQRIFNSAPTQEKDMNSDKFDDLDRPIYDVLSEIQKMPDGDQILSKIFEEGITAKILVNGISVEELQKEREASQALEEELDGITR